MSRQIFAHWSGGQTAIASGLLFGVVIVAMAPTMQSEGSIRGAFGQTPSARPGLPVPKPALQARTARVPNMDKWTGTWLLNIGKSKFGGKPSPPGMELVKQILKIRVADGNLDLYSHMEMADGTDVADESHLADLSGKPHITEFDGFKPVSEIFKAIDNNTFELTIKAQTTDLMDEPDMQVTVKVRFAISADGRTISETKDYSYKEAGAGRAAKEVSVLESERSTLVYDKQPQQ